MINIETLDWLLRGDVSIQYQVHRDLLNLEKPDLQKQIEKEGWGKMYLSLRKPNGHWGLGFYQPKWISTHYTLLDLRTLSYSEENEQAFWVYYELTPELINGTQSRTDDFRADPMVSNGSASLTDYSGSEYDRGHLCPAADMTLNMTSMSESFYLSNMSPQVAGFNRGIWSTLESQVRKWALEYSRLYVVTGPIFKMILLQ